MNAKDKTKKHFDRTAKDYDNSGDGKFVAPMYGVMVDEIQKRDGGKILDVGCGNGNLFSLLPEGKYDLYGIDFSENMIEEAKRKCEVKASFSVADAERLPFDDETFDAVVCNASFHHYTNPDAVLMEMNRVLKDDGRLLIGDPYLPSYVRPFVNVLVKFSDKGDYHFYSESEMNSLFEKNGFMPISFQMTGERTALFVAGK